MAGSGYAFTAVQRRDEDRHLIQYAHTHQGLAEQNDLRRDGPPMTVEIKMIGNRPSGHTPVESDRIVQWAMATADWAGEEPELRTSSTDCEHPYIHNGKFPPSPLVGEVRGMARIHWMSGTTTMRDIKVFSGRCWCSPPLQVWNRKKA
ncbi:MAG: hypothetical protein U5K69_05875 [Balneolaceae bacterium]|nr:hypothetical protein [Balneolaceae bacterium]